MTRLVAVRVGAANPLTVASHLTASVKGTTMQCRNCQGEFGCLSFRQLCLKCERQKIELEMAERERLRTVEWHLGPMSPEDAVLALKAMPAHIPPDHPDLQALRKIAGPLADHPELVKGTPSGNGTAATEALAATETSPAWNDLRQAAFTSVVFVRAAERLRRSLEGDDEDAIFVECGWYCKYACDLDALFKPADWERDRSLTVRALRLGHMLDARWLSLKSKSGITELDLILNQIDALTTEYNPGDPFPFWVGHELTYRRFYENAVELLEVLNQPISTSFQEKMY